VSKRILSDQTRAAIWLIMGGVTDDAQVAWATGMTPEKDLTRIDWVCQLRSELSSVVSLKHDIYCDQHDSKITTAPCLSCNCTSLRNLPPKFSVVGPLWDTAKRQIQERRDGIRGILKKDK